MSEEQLVYKKKKKKFKVFPIVNAILFIIIACAIMIPIYKVLINPNCLITRNLGIIPPSKIIVKRSI